MTRVVLPVRIPMEYVTGELCGLEDMVFLNIDSYMAHIDDNNEYSGDSLVYSGGNEWIVAMSPQEIDMELYLAKFDKDFGRQITKIW